MNPEDKKTIEILENTAQGLKLNSVFEVELQKRLTAAHKPKRDLFSSLRKNILPTLGWSIALAALVLILNWSAHSILSSNPASSDGFSCPVTEPNGSLPPGETVESKYYLGNGQLWTALWPDGKIYMDLINKESDGAFSMKWGWVRAVTGPLTIEGHRLDKEAPPLRADIPDGYGDTGLQISALIFPTTGCWEVTGRVGDASLTFVTEVVFGEATPTPESMQEISTPAPTVAMTSVPNNEGYDWRGTTLTLAGSLPESPAEANVYSLKLSQPATMDEAQALAQQFGLVGEVTETPGEIPGNFDYLLIDGKQKLTVRSDHFFTFYSDFENFTLGTVPAEQAMPIIDEFLKQHGFDFEFRADNKSAAVNQQYYILPLTPDGFEMRLDAMMPLRYEVSLSADLKNIILSGYAINFESLGKFGILLADEAFQKVLNPNQQSGIMEMSRGHGGGGGGGSFYKVNLSGIPVPFPTPNPNVEIPTPLAAELIGQRVDGLRGTVSVSIYKNADGTQRIEYAFIYQKDDGSFQFSVLEGADLQAYQNRVLKVWGTFDHLDQNFNPVINLERFEDPYPNADFQIVKGSQKVVTIDGQDVTLFTTEDGKNFSERNPWGEVFSAVWGDPAEPKKEVLLEVLILPDESFGGYPSLRVFAGILAINTKTGQPGELSVTADQLAVVEAAPPSAQSNLPPTAVIETIELVYFIRNPLQSMTDPKAGDDAQYLQPVWRFYGHYSNGDEFEILIQALKDEFLYPELAPYTPPG
ncbi:MAG: hypothetical protein HZB50_07320 [Chloroflexi bacterium]|nr:hypothetical protein [Chloroflexota bacterium]